MTRLWATALLAVAFGFTVPAASRADDAPSPPTAVQPHTVTVAVEPQAWQKRRMEFAATVGAAAKGDKAALQALATMRTAYDADPFARTPMENMDFVGMFYAPTQDLGKIMPMIVANAALGWYDALRFGSASGRAEISNNEAFFKKALMMGGPETVQKALKLIQDEPAESAKLVEEGLKLAELHKDDPRYDHRWPTAYGLERMSCAMGNPCTSIPEMLKEQWADAWNQAIQRVHEYYAAKK